MVFVKGDNEVTLDLPDMGIREFINAPVEKMSLFSGEKGSTFESMLSVNNLTARPLPPRKLEYLFDKILSVIF